MNYEDNGLLALIKQAALDPLGKEDKDVDNNGKIDNSDKYLKNRRGVIGNALAASRKSGEKMAKDIQRNSK